MTSRRLTNGDRDRVREAALRATFDPRREALHRREAELAIRCYDAVLPASVRVLVSQLPEGWVHRASKLRFNVGGLDVTLNLADSDNRRIPLNGRGYGERLGAVDNAKLCAAVNELLSDKDKLKADEERAAAQLSATLHSVTTYAALCELWPDGELYYRFLSMEAKKQRLPAPQIAELNAALGLPKKARKS